MRYHPVVVSRYIGMYRAKDPVCWAIADSKQANAVATADRYDEYAEAKAAADTMNEREESPEIKLYMEDGMTVSTRHEKTWADMLPWMWIYCPGYVHMHVRQRKNVTRVFLYN